MTLDEQIAFCEEKSKNIKLKAEPQVFVGIKAAKKGQQEISVEDRLHDMPKEDKQ